MTFKPMLASKISDVEKLVYPVLASPKLDGIRCIVYNGVAYSRNMKPIPNKVVAQMLNGLPSLDGELIVGPPGGKDVFNRTSSAIMSREGVPEFTYWVFDVVLNRDLPFNQRLDLAKEWAAASGNYVKHVAHKLVKSAEGLLEYEAQMLLAGYEGVMVRSLDGMYKRGRSTEREGALLKLKRFEDSEAEVIGFVEKMRNENEQTRDELGRAKRSSHKAGKRAANTLGALEVRDIHSGVEFEIGTGFDDELRAAIWDAQDETLGKVVKYKFQPTGVKDKPRFPVFLGFRHDGDI